MSRRIGDSNVLFGCKRRAAVASAAMTRPASHNFASCRWPQSATLLEKREPQGASPLSRSKKKEKETARSDDDDDEARQLACDKGPLSVLSGTALHSASSCGERWECTVKTSDRRDGSSVSVGGGRWMWAATAAERC